MKNYLIKIFERIGSFFIARRLPRLDCVKARNDSRGFNFAYGSLNSVSGSLKTQNLN
ncbi:MAG: hypothetical protein IKZ88_07590 [Neisseriaceae bacterium]|nr:hypothetical protein [Neisseriaceae bacterium]